MTKELLFRIGILLATLFPLLSLSQELTDGTGKIQLKENWFVQHSAKINQTGSSLSTHPINTSNWYKTSVPATVMGVLTANGLYKDAFMGDNYKNIDKKQFDNSWWYYRQFEIPHIRKGQHVSLQFEGINYYANIWLNGKLIASRDSIFGTFRMFSMDVTELLKTTNNILAIEIFRAQPGDFNLGFVDWNPRPVDENMGIWRGVYLHISGDVSLQHTYIESDVNTITLDEASLTIKTNLKNNTTETVNGILKGKFENVKFSIPVKLNPGATLALTLTPEQISAFKIKQPRLWWCNNLGTPELYHLIMRFEMDGVISDIEETTFGIRKIEMFTNALGHKGFKLNGKEVLIKGAGWTDDIFLRDSLTSLETQIQYVKHMNLNTIRFESFWGTSQDVYKLCDKYGILAMVGWSCQWEWDEYLGKPCGEFGGIQSEEDMDLAINSFRDQLLWLRNHPSIFVWLVGSDKCPKPELEKRYAQLFKSLDNRPYLASAGTRVSEVSGPTGVKMNGPYEYVSPNYWYIDTINGGAFGFNTETGPGPQVPMLESLKKMIPADKMWPPNEMWNYHCTHSIQAFNKMDVFNTALESRYGKSSNEEDYLLKSNAQSYEAMKGMFEAFRANIPKTTGIIQWMLNSAWPSMYWQLYDYYLRPTAAYYAARSANQPVQLIYNYGDHSVYLINETHQEIKDLKATIKILDENSVISLDMSTIINALPLSSEQIVPFESIHGIQFLDLQLHDADGNEVAENFYWLSEKPDEFAWDKTTWAYTPMKAFTDFTLLSKLPASEIKLAYEKSENGDDIVIHTRLTNPTEKLAFFISLSLNNKKGASICPVFWDDNYFSLLPGESREINCVVSKQLMAKVNPYISVSGWNIKPQHIDLK